MCFLTLDFIIDNIRSLPCQTPDAPTHSSKNLCSRNRKDLKKKSKAQGLLSEKRELEHAF